MTETSTMTMTIITITINILIDLGNTKVTFHLQHF